MITCSVILASNEHTWLTRELETIFSPRHYQRVRWRNDWDGAHDPARPG